ncbi:RagB/SusD family nutrient uptake outer membrane protein [Seonamhaeicola maritimus]|uniref:RagB/SusD family nutrient uptake outer membrane protein n=1 Tax=Seonamhaeicola maritimus TaxID=2591822 RepID=A0A5C7GE83_9FLAO|nr:RagB/SusD family nutrient uptake outer membrane protein [Seonamhaeicola maritimus]TXG35143.1 RagB/SusD family nutrient uptake outer membrane protein [Seonamhaeicola maritimus]
MKHILLKSIMLIFAMSSLFSCSDNEFLQEQNPNIIGVDRFWRNLTETNSGLNAVYQTLHHPAVLNIIAETLRSDMGYPGYGRPVPQNTEDFYLHTYNGGTNEIIDKWQTCYQGIFRANQVIEALDNIKETTDDEKEWASQMAQARFFRGLFHYYLYTTFNEGSIIIRDFVPITNEDYAKALSPAEDVIAFVRQDLEYAYANLYKKGEYPDGDVSRVTSGAAATILGHSYLQDLEYAKAIPYFDDVINNHGYELEYDLDKMFTNAGEFNGESIFEINFSAADADLTNESRWTGETGTNWLNQQTSNTRGAVGPAWIAYAYKTEPMDPLDNRNYYNDPDNGLTLRNVPLRASSMIALVDDTQTTYYEVQTSAYGRFHGTAWGFAWWKKYTNHDIVSTEGQLPTGSATLSEKNVVVNRLAEVILMQAECKIKTGDVDGAIELINDIRKRWGLVLLGAQGADTNRTYDDVVYDEDSLMRHLMYIEKPLETSIEGHVIRWLDFLRWEKSDGYSFKDRLAELSQVVLYGVNFTYVNDEGNTRTRFNFPSLEGQQPSGAHIVVDYEYDTSVLNFNESTQKYYPIPFAEANANPNIN